ncbi:MAG: hypothetical protein ACYTFI_07065 [Planctomycetota bacterium]
MGASRWRIVVVAGSAFAVGAFAAVFVTLLVKPPGPRLSKDADEIRRLIPAAAGIPEAEWHGFPCNSEPLSTWMRASWPDPTERDSWPADLEWLLAPDHVRGDLLVQFKEAVGAETDLHYVMASHIEAAMNRGGFVSLVHLDCISGYECSISGDNASGWFTFGATGLWRGRAEFMAVRGPSGWSITAFRFPSTGRVVYLRADGFWRSELPEDRPPRPTPYRIVVRITRDGLPRTMRRTITFQKLREVLRPRVQSSPSRPDGRSSIFLKSRPHPASRYGSLAKVLSLCTELGIPGVAMYVQSRRIDIPLPSAAGERPDRITVRLAPEEASTTTDSQQPYCRPGTRVSVSLAGDRCADLDEFERKLRKRKESDGGLAVVVDADPHVPAQWVFDTLQVCKEADVAFRLALPGAAAEAP